jgi:TRAP-type C4-dicarboxylate transport system permease small subunit
MDSIRKLSMLPLLLSLLVLAWGMTTIMQEVAVWKVLALGFLGGAMAQTLAAFSLGIVVCAVLYAFTIFYEGAPKDGFRSSEGQESTSDEIAW